MQEEQDPWYHPDRLIPTGLRVGGGVTGGIMGGAAGSIVPGAGTIGGVALGGGAGSYIGDALAQGYEYLRGDRPEGYNVKSGLVEGGLGAIPLMGKAPAMTAPAKEWFRHAATAPFVELLKELLLVAVAPVAHSLVEQARIAFAGKKLKLVLRLVLVLVLLLLVHSQQFLQLGEEEQLNPVQQRLGMLLILEIGMLVVFLMM